MSACPDSPHHRASPHHVGRCGALRFHRLTCPHHPNGPAALSRCACATSTGTSTCYPTSFCGPCHTNGHHLDHHPTTSLPTIHGEKCVAAPPPTFPLILCKIRQDLALARPEPELQHQAHAPMQITFMGAKGSGRPFQMLPTIVLQATGPVKNTRGEARSLQIMHPWSSGYDVTLIR